MMVLVRLRLAWLHENQGIHPEVDPLDSGEGSKWIWKCQKILNGPELGEGLLNLNLLVNVVPVLEKNFLGLTNGIHRLFSALADGKQILEQLEDPDLPFEGQGSSDITGVEPSAVGGKELNCCLGQRQV
jgi:hypothetical protein